MGRQKYVLHFDDINASHEAMGFTGRTNLPDFHIYTLEETYPSTRRMMPPYTFRFYCIVLLEENSHDAVIDMNTKHLHGPSNTISFQSPGHVSSWVRGEAQRCIILYFQPEFLSHHPNPLLEDFPFFRPTQNNIIPLTGEEKNILRKHFIGLEHTFQGTTRYRVQMLQALLLALLYESKGMYERYSLSQLNIAGKSTLATQFLLLLEQHYLTRQSVQSYAELLHVTPNHLSQVVSHALGQKASKLILERVLLEAKKLLYYTDLNIREIAEYLGFEEPTHFIRLFKRKLSMTPLEYRHSIAEKNVSVVKS